ncbi:hypothetical protein OMK64_06175 [Cellulomonas fimi]|uniref:hypothetical protein n=1 Tax=Cellulomonas fimi TaxID=1708 RepID=UPI00234E2364|nr:hypothetical protein [Cellulomonas fimi]MDC7121120.1 hypothetical protein [Cellulomonas fimi]
MTSQSRPDGADAPTDALRVDPEHPDVLVVDGDVDVASVLDLADELGVTRGELGPALVAAGVRAIDLSRATFIDSSVIAVLVTVASHQSSRVPLVGASGSPLMALEASGVLAMFDRDDAAR